MSATKQQLDQLKLMVPAAQASAAHWGVPASITLAQWALESAWGTSQLARRSNNFFGVKALQGEAYSEFVTRECVLGRSVEEMAHFAFYPTAEAGFTAHAQLLATLARYSDFMKFALQGGIMWACVALGKSGYSTDPEYGQALFTLIQQFHLTQYDLPLPPHRTTVTT